jgi:hypothetical protein
MRAGLERFFKVGDCIMANNVGEGAPNWLSGLIGEKRRAIDRWLPRLERRAEAKAIVEAIRQHPDGKALANHPELESIMWEALGVANAIDEEIRKNPVLRVSGNVAASLYIFKETGVPVPPA